MFENLQPVCYGVISTFFALSTTTILFRIYARQFIIKNFGWDDWCMVAVLVCPGFDSIDVIASY